MKTNKHSESEDMNKYRHMHIIYRLYSCSEALRRTVNFVLINALRMKRLLFVFLQSLFAIGEQYESIRTPE